jgi:arylsulfatase A-like enzyme
MLSALGVSLAATVAMQCSAREQPIGVRPNIVLLMADDLGWGDVGFNGGSAIRTPHLDEMAEAGIVFSRFYSAAPVCSPTRGSCLTGRHPYRYGIRWANIGHIPKRENTLAELLAKEGYATGHFGKWHLGTLTKTERDSNRGGREHARHYAPPWENGFEECFSSEANMPTWNPGFKPGTDEAYVGSYWTGAGQRVREGLEGDDSRVIMDRALRFVRKAAQAERPFFAVVWFHTPHKPVLAGPEYLETYPGIDEKQRHYNGCVTAMDDQVGRLRAELRELGIAGETMLWFCSDNGPEGDAAAPGSTGGLRARKRSLFEGGIRVPAVLEWSGFVQPGSTTALPAVTSDFLPTILSSLELPLPDLPLDGIDILAAIRGARSERGADIMFESWHASFEGSNRLAAVGDRYKLLARIGSADEIEGIQLFDLIDDPAETTDIADREAQVARRMAASLADWRRSCRRSEQGRD